MRQRPPALQLLRVTSVLVILALGLAPQVLALPFPSVTFHGTPLSESGTANGCDSLNCQSDIGNFAVTDFLPQFGLVGKTLLSVEISYDVRSQVGASVTNGSASTVQAFARLEADAAFSFGRNTQLFGVEDLEEGDNQNRTVPPGQTLTFTDTIAHVGDTVVLLPGDAPFPLFLGHDFVELHSGAGGALNGNSTNRLLAPIIVTWDFQGDFDLTYQFCTPHVPGCPPAIPGFNSPVPAPAALLLVSAGVIGLFALGARRTWCSGSLAVSSPGVNRAACSAAARVYASDWHRNGVAPGLAPVGRGEWDCCSGSRRIEVEPGAGVEPATY